MTLEEKVKFVKTDKFLNWLVEFTNNQNNCWDDETIRFDMKGYNAIDRNNAGCLSYFHDLIKEKAKGQFVFSIPSRRGEIQKYYFKLRDDFYEIYRLAVNEDITVIRKINDAIDNYVYLDKKIPNEIKKQRELIQYIIINGDLDIPASVYAVHIAHASTIALTNEINNKEKFDLWYNNGENQKKIILSTNEEYLIELEKDFYSIRDIGHNNIPPNSLIAVSLGIMSKKDAIKYTQNCTLWN